MWTREPNQYVKIKTRVNTCIPDLNSNERLNGYKTGNTHRYDQRTQRFRISDLVMGHNL